MDHVEAEGATIDEAIANALKLLGVARNRASIEILAEARKGVLGIGAKPARVRASIRQRVLEEEREQSEQGGAREPVASEAQIAAAADKGKQVLTEILKLMGFDRAVLVKRGEAPDEVILEIQGDSGGLLIGRHGQTLEALQYLLMRIVSGGRGREAVQLELDTESYRERRRKSLEDMALRLGEKAKRQRKTVTVDPMNAAERRVIHAALEDDPWLTTKSVGGGAYRRVLIIPEGDRKRKDEARRGGKPEPDEEK